MKGAILSLALFVVVVNSIALDFNNNIYLKAGPITSIKPLHVSDVSNLVNSYLIERSGNKAQFIFHFTQSELETREDLLMKKQQVEKFLNIALDDYIPHNAFRAFADVNNKLVKVQELVSGLSIVKVEPNHKIASTLGEIHSAVESNRVTLHVILMDNSVVNVQSLNIPSVYSSQQDKSNLYITLSVDDALEAAQQLSRYEDVDYVSIITEDKPMNLNAGLISISGVGMQEDKYYKQFRTALNGTKQLVTVTDTGLDYNGCFFYDKKGFDFHDIKTPAKPNTHRKIQGYLEIMDRFANHTHGTHVAGTVAGLSACTKNAPSLIDYNGIAQNAKILFTDIGCDQEKCFCPEGVPCSCGEMGCQNGQLGVPFDYGEHLFKWSVVSGSHIHTNSWGSATKEYTAVTKNIDNFANKNPMFLILFAAGNANDIVGVQAHAKNIITVGSSDTDYSTFKNDHFHVIDYDQLAKDTHKLLKARFGTWCDSIPEDEWTDDCKFLNEPVITSETCCKYTLDHPNCGKELKGSNLLKCCKKCTQDYSLLLKETIHPSNVSFFSSYGPTTDGRIKPDFVVPGNELLSARSHFPPNTPEDHLKETSLHFHLEGMRGTSMATPTAAGLSALVRQYFVNGYHTDGKKGFEPSASLIKATLVNAATPMKENVTYPEARAGFGRVQFNESFPILDIPSKISLIAYDNIVVEDEKSYIFNVQSNSRPLQLTLVWSDPVASTLSKVLLVNDLDLVLTDPNGKKINANLHENDTDVLNNVEKIRIEEPEKGLYTVQVVHKKEADPNQKFSLVITGHVVSLSREELQAAKRVKLIVMISVICLTVVTIAAFVIASLIQRRKTKRGYTQIE